VPDLAVARIALALVVIAGLVAAPPALGQAGVSYQVPPDNPFVGVAAPEIYAYGLRNPYRFSFDRLTGDLLIGDVGGAAREEVDWVSAATARGANFGWACREGSVAGPRLEDCPVPGAIEPLFDYATGSPRAVTGGFVVRDPSLSGLVGRYLYADYYDGEIRSLALTVGAPDDQTTGAILGGLASFGEDAAGRLFAVGQAANQLVRLDSAGPGLLAAQPLGGTLSAPVAIGTFPGDPTRLFVAEQGGTVRLVVDGAVRPTPFLDVTPFGLGLGGERGLLSVVAAPDYASSGKIYVYYTESGGDIRLDEFRRSATNPEQADPTTRRPVFTIEHSSAGNHNGGQLHFGPDGCLWITTGDGGGQDNQFDNAQNLSTLLGKVLRIDPDPPGSGAPCAPSAPPPPAPPTNPQPLPRDVTRPLLRSSARARQRALRLGGVIVVARCANERCRLSASGRLRIGKRRYALKGAVRTAGARQRVRLKVALTKRARGALRRALRRGRRASVRIELRARDDAGNVSVARRVVRVRR
jgi:glucose/arabinose dehydrogenase